MVAGSLKLQTQSLGYEYNQFSSFFLIFLIPLSALLGTLLGSSMGVNQVLINMYING